MLLIKNGPTSRISVEIFEKDFFLVFATNPWHCGVRFCLQEYGTSIPGVYPGFPQTSKTKCFAVITNGFWEAWIGHYIY